MLIDHNQTLGRDRVCNFGGKFLEFVRRGTCTTVYGKIADAKKAAGWNPAAYGY